MAHLARTLPGAARWGWVALLGVVCGAVYVARQSLESQEAYERRLLAGLHTEAPIAVPLSARATAKSHPTGRATAQSHPTGSATAQPHPTPERSGAGGSHASVAIPPAEEPVALPNEPTEEFRPREALNITELPPLHSVNSATGAWIAVSSLFGHHAVLQSISGVVCVFGWASRFGFHVHGSLRWSSGKSSEGVSKYASLSSGPYPCPLRPAAGATCPARRYELCFAHGSLAGPPEPALLSVWAGGDGWAPAKLELRDIVVGDVILCTGQSNSALPAVGEAREWQAAEDRKSGAGSGSDRLEEFSSPAGPLLRLLQLEPLKKRAPFMDSPPTADPKLSPKMHHGGVSWVVAESPSRISAFPLLCYSMAKAVMKRRCSTHRCAPLGVIAAASFSTEMVFFLPPREESARLARPECLAQFDQYRTFKFIRAGVSLPYEDSPINPFVHNSLYLPLRGGRFAGAVFWHGHSDSRKELVPLYSCALEVFFASLRANTESRVWPSLKNTVLPVVMVQLHSDREKVDISSYASPGLREVQEKFVRSSSAMTLVPSYDICRLVVHPARKHIVGERVASHILRWAGAEQEPSPSPPAAVRVTARQNGSKKDCNFKVEVEFDRSLPAASEIHRAIGSDKDCRAVVGSTFDFNQGPANGSAPTTRWEALSVHDLSLKGHTAEFTFHCRVCKGQPDVIWLAYAYRPYVDCVITSSNKKMPLLPFRLPIVGGLSC